MIRPRSALGGFTSAPISSAKAGRFPTSLPALRGKVSPYPPPLAEEGSEGAVCRTEPQSARLSAARLAQARSLVFDASILRSQFPLPTVLPKMGGEGRAGPLKLSTRGP